MNGLVKYRVIERYVEEVINSRLVKNKRVVIIEEFTSKDGVSISIPSALNSILYPKFKNKSVATARNYADVICPFLNYIKVQVTDGEDEKFDILLKEGLYGLNFYHACSYLNYCIDSKGISYETAMQYTEHILNFYHHLDCLKILKSDVKFTYTMAKVPGSKARRRVRDNPFKDEPYTVSYPSKNRKKKRKLNNMDEHLWNLFLKISKQYTPDITLGIVFQMFGGLRRGEVVNLDINSIKKSRKENISQLMLIIRNRQLELFKDRDVNISKCGVKRERDQVVFNFNGELVEYIDVHLKLRNEILKRNSKYSEALFVDENGNAMCGITYEKIWSKLKKEFLKELSLNIYSEFKDFDESTWGTHIGRGIFSNLCLEYGLASNARELANLRGDIFEDSSKPYVDLFKVSGKVMKSLNFIGADVKSDRW
ncbi:hypothetical protein [Paraclostridium sordellii]|uniref:hypothetical protein n=1 Tax=Paraclostridium sordellii TaxID=1505 RepID=UPI0030D00EEF